MDLLIEPARGADARAVAEIAEAAYARYVARIGRRPAPMDDDFPALIDAGQVIVVRRGAAILGYAVSWRDSGAWHLSNVAVTPDAAGQGVGRALIDAVEGMAREAGAEAVELYTHVTMTENRALYPRLGYEVTGERVENGFHRVYFRKLL